MGGESEKEVERDISRAEEYTSMYMGATLKGAFKVELRTGVIPAARYASKLRRVAFAVLRGTAPNEVIIRDISELNKELYHKIVEEMKCQKGDLIRITVDATYDEENKKIIFENLKIERFVPESEIKKKYEEELERLRKENEELKRKIDKIRKLLS